MLPHDKTLALSATEVETLRDLRMRLGRKAVSDKALGALGTAFFQVCERVSAGWVNAVPPTVVSAEAAASASAEQLRGLVAALSARKAAAPSTWTAAVAAGVPQAIISRRLALAGREPAIDTESVI